TASSQYGCVSKDSVRLRVLKPFSIHVPADSFVCKGSKLYLPVSGASTYHWISGPGISDLTSERPLLTPTQSSTYSVVGYDDGSCFTDTASVHIEVKPLPSVDAGPDIEALTGNPQPLQAQGSNDIIRWAWTPVDQLSCSNCASPVAKPRGNTSYIVTATNQWGCSVADTVLVKLTCDQRYIAIPNACTPDNNGSNDVFYIKGRGVRMVQSFRVYGRWGELVFEKKQVAIDDRAAGWNGTINGQPAPAGTYVYFAELVCDTGEVFERKGTVLLLR
ncbi:MAG TPA: gliding motility-associated C-terminal domain-containing protein, partial [Chitinophagaceae bacterium]|nr:gliding motility-associated C-terminal domain-containing protein [Chitinophagaceae bacterium]